MDALTLDASALLHTLVVGVVAYLGLVAMLRISGKRTLSAVARSIPLSPGREPITRLIRAFSEPEAIRSIRFWSVVPDPLSRTARLMGGCGGMYWIFLNAIKILL
jgi:hypothetical protein